MTVNELKQLASLISVIQIKKEETQGQYDVKQSMSAASSFDQNCQNIAAVSSTDFIKQLKAIIEQRKTTMSNDYAGEFNGGKGTLNTCFCHLSDIVKQKTNFKSANLILIKELKLLGKSNYSFIDILEMIDDKIKLQYLLLLIIISVLMTTIWLW